MQTEILQAIERGQALKDTCEHDPDAQIDFDEAIRRKRERIDNLIAAHRSIGALIKQECQDLAHLLTARMWCEIPKPIRIEVKEKPSNGGFRRAGNGRVEIIGSDD